MPAEETAAVASMPCLKFNNGLEIPAVGLGTWKSAPGEVQKAVEAALSCGYTHIDAAWVYGNEKEVGDGIKASGITREKVFVTSKLWNAFHAPEDVETACREGLTNLGLDYLDLYLIHWPVCLRKGASMPPKADDFTDVPIEDTWRAMEALVEKGLVKSIGLSNFSIPRMEKILAMCKVKPVVNQVELHPFLQQPKLKDFCDKENILLTAYGPLGSPDRPARVLDAADPVLLEDETLQGIAKDVERTPAEICIRWAVQRGTVVIPKSVTPARIKQNLRAAMEPLPETAMEKLSKMDRHLRLFKGTLWTPEGTEGPIKDARRDLWQD